MDMLAGAEPFDAAKHRSTREPGMVGTVHDLGVDRLVMPHVGLTDEDRESLGRSSELHLVSFRTDA